MSQGEDTPQEPLQAVRSIGKSHPPNSVAPASPDEIFHVEIQVDPKTQKEIVLWEDIVQAFEHAVQVRHKSKIVPFLKGSDFITLEPRRIAAVPNAVLDVVVSTPSANMEGSSPKNLSKGSVSVLAQEDDTAGKDFVIQDDTTTSTVRVYPVCGLMKEAMENYSQIERPPAFPFARGPDALLDDLSPDNDNSPAPPHPGNGNNLPSRVLQSATAPDTLREQKDLVQMTISASRGDKDALVTLGDAYRKGKGVPQDYQAAMDWYLKAVEHGDPVGQQRVGAMYSHGLGVQRDYFAALNWFLKAANQGNASAQCNIGSFYRFGQEVPRDYEQAMIWFRKAADQGNAKAQFNIASLYAIGCGVPQDYEQAMLWYLKAADQGHVDSQYNIGVSYHKGQGVHQDYAQAMEWYLKAANQGNALAQSNIGLLYNLGQGVPQDYAKAAEWYQRAADQGHIDAKTALENMRRRGRFVG